jgi:uncharacterized cupin superfamily protein
MVWECTPREFIWHYPEDETVVERNGFAVGRRGIA